MRVLVVEDEIRMATLVQKALMGQSLAVDIAGNGEDALRLASGVPYDVILLDIVLPGMNGLDVCRTLRQKGVSSSIIMVSGKSAVEDRVSGLDIGADDYLAKPFSYSELMARIRAVTRRQGSGDARMTQFEDVVVDYDQRLVTRDGQKIDLSPKEFRILEFFLRHRGKVLSRYDILENVWGSGTNLFSNVVDVHISNLRNKLNKGFEKQIIRTVRNGGYILD